MSEKPATRRWFQFRLRTLLIAMVAASLLVSIATGPLGYEYRKNRLRTRIVSWGGTVEQCGLSHDPVPGSNWLSRAMGLGTDPEPLWHVNLAKSTATADDLEALIGWQCIRRLELTGLLIGDDALEPILTLTKLRELGLRDTQVTDKGVSRLVVLKRLISLDVRLTKATYESLATLDRELPDTNFQEQAAVRAAGPDRVMAGGWRAPNHYAAQFGTDEVDFRYRMSESAIGIRLEKRWPLTAVEIEHLRRLKSTKALMCNGVNFPAGGLAWLSELTNLRQVSVYGGNLTDADLAHLAKLPALRELELTKVAVSDAGIRVLEGAPQLESLRLATATITPRVVESLKAIPKLKTIELQFWVDPGVSPEFVYDSDETANFLRQLKEMPQLKVLVLRGDVISDEAILVLCELKQLYDLTVCGRDASETLAKRLQQALPNSVVTVRP